MKLKTFKKNCLVCGKEFEAKAINAKYCYDCKNKYGEKHLKDLLKPQPEKKQKEYHIKCMRCGKEMIFDNPHKCNTKYCDACRKVIKNENIKLINQRAKQNSLKKKEEKRKAEKAPIITIEQMERKAMTMGITYGMLDLMMRQGKINVKDF